MARLQEYYRETIVPELMKKLGCKNVMEIPKIEKITVNMGVGEALTDRKVLDNAMAD
ncbi:MAG: 50S ribosomal protein L5, partial [Gammaproteobacteria bacterium]